MIYQSISAYVRDSICPRMQAILSMIKIGSIRKFVRTIVNLHVFRERLNLNGTQIQDPENYWTYMSTLNACLSSSSSSSSDCSLMPPIFAITATNSSNVKVPSPYEA